MVVEASWILSLLCLGTNSFSLVPPKAECKRKAHVQIVCECNLTEQWLNDRWVSLSWKNWKPIQGYIIKLATSRVTGTWAQWAFWKASWKLSQNLSLRIKFSVDSCLPFFNVALLVKAFGIEYSWTLSNFLWLTFTCCGFRESPGQEASPRQGTVRLHVSEDLKPLLNWPLQQWLEYVAGWGNLRWV